MKINFDPKPMLYPMPVLIIGTYDKNFNPDAMNAAWGGISEETEISICVSDDHKTTENVLLNKAFSVSVADVKNLVAADFVGIVSGYEDAEKISKTGWNCKKSDFVNAPVFDELPFTLECKLKSYDKNTCRLVGEIVNVSADETILTNGKIDLSKFKPICFDPSNRKYVALGETVGNAFKDGLQLK